MTDAVAYPSAASAVQDALVPFHGDRSGALNDNACIAHSHLAERLPMLYKMDISLLSPCNLDIVDAPSTSSKWIVRPRCS
jgi:hypothetical protein